MGTLELPVGIAQPRGLRELEALVKLLSEMGALLLIYVYVEQPYTKYATGKTANIPKPTRAWLTAWWPLYRDTLQLTGQT